MPKQPGRPDHDAMSGEVDRLLRQLSPEDARRGYRTPMGGASGPIMGTGPESIHPSRYDDELDHELDEHVFELDVPAPFAVWARVILGVLLAAGLTQWPYRFCGLSLGVYLVAAAMLLVTGVWAGVGSWRNRMGIAHTLSITVIIAGTVFGALRLVPLIGGTSTASVWSCFP